MGRWPFRSDRSELTKAESEIFQLLTQTPLSEKEIAHTRNASPKSVNAQVLTVYRKMRVHGRVELILRYAKCVCGATLLPGRIVTPPAAGASDQRKAWLAAAYNPDASPEDRAAANQWLEDEGM